MNAWHDESHPARAIWEFLGGLDLSRFEAQVKVKVGSAGRDSWPPRLLIGMWIYAYSRGISSAREIERQCHWEPGFQWLTGLQKVNHHTLSDFRVEHAEAMKELFEQVLTVLMMKGLVTLERVTMDGTKVRAHVNKKTFSKPAKLRAYQEEVAKHVAVQGRPTKCTREDCKACKMRKRCTPNNKMPKHGRTVGIRLEDDSVDAFLARMDTDEAKATYKTRAPIAEFPNAWIKTKLNWARVRSRGLKRVAVEAIWPALTYNLQRYFAITRAQTQTA